MRFIRTKLIAQRLLQPKDARLRLGVRDALIMGITFVVYCVVAFTNLGSTKAPQTAWVSASAEDQVVFELPEKTTFKLLYFAGVSYHNFTVSVSDDGETWSEPTICRMREGLVLPLAVRHDARLMDDINSESFAADSAAQRRLAHGQVPARQRRIRGPEPVGDHAAG